MEDASSPRTLRVPAAVMTRASPSLPPIRKIMSKNNNNTTHPTSYPSNQAELQLYRVMQNASLLLYYDTLLEMGGDDVQSLCDTGEEEFLEIMSLVGMASKPLHVRRFQKSLQEWVTNPAKFKVALVPGEDYEIELSSPRITSNQTSAGFAASATESDCCRNVYSPSSETGPVSFASVATNKRPYSPLETACPSSSSSSSPGNNPPSLLDSQIQKLSAAAEKLSKQLPQFEPKPYNNKKRVCKELEAVMSMPSSDPRRVDEIRKYAAIYGRFDCKRKPEKPLTLHEISVNEAAAQICKFIPALLTRRDELFPLARQVVKDSGCYYSKTFYSGRNQDSSESTGSALSQTRCSPRSTSHEAPDASSSSAKRPKHEHHEEHQENEPLMLKSSSVNSLLYSSSNQIYYSESKRSSSLMEYEDDGDSHYSYSNSSSPTHQAKHDSQEDEDASKFSPKVQVIAASGDNIIAVANPALIMSSAIIPPLLESKLDDLDL